MSKSTKYLLVSLPTSISSSNDREEAFGALQATAAKDSESVLPFTIPEFKVGSLDALVQQADDLGKLEGACEAVANKVGDSLRTILEGDEGKLTQQKTVNDSQCRGIESRLSRYLYGPEPVDQYLRSFNWNKVKYRADRPLSSIIDILQKVLVLHGSATVPLSLT